MSLIDRLLAGIVPHECLGCGTEGSLLCGPCGEALRPVPERCYRCRKLAKGSMTCAVCRKSSLLYRVQVASVYEGAAKSLLWRLKFAGTQAAAREMAARMLLFSQPEPEAIIVPVPTATNRARQRGYDQAELLARELARRTHLPYVPALARLTKAHQVGAGRQQRLTQLRTGFRVCKSRVVSNSHIILVDDVVTTGATLEAAAMTLRDVGASRIDALVFAQP